MFENFSDIQPWINSLGLLGCLGTGLAAYFKFKPAAMKVEGDIERELRRSMLGRIKSLERDNERCEGQNALVRHRLGNETGSLTALLMMLKIAPERISDSVDLIIADRLEKHKAYMLERAAFLTRWGLEDDADDEEVEGAAEPLQPLQQKPKL